ncbi:CCR4-NOT transcription complex subunit 10 [Diachasma alloeum]|uniref:CCR4-NOT transcription complex subunit 10 n=1 Tax=Diachasma alloeum TaxID=454923 RepID=UPI0007382DEE|nr:CCR4-NOT transcription complex subunit 10 [Diachasma alloeum]XP_015110062.1 CCR4-NOT transcription complex subunit 10 [Diachasma alloeum]
MMENTESSGREAGAVIITEQERDLAQNALAEFQKRSYTSCLTYLNKLEALRPKDLKVMHNKVIIEYYKNDLKRTELAKKSLNAICGAPTTLDSAPDNADDVEKSVMRFNQAVLLYHTGQDEPALQILTRLFALVEPMEENLAWNVCLLLIELHIVTSRLDAALALINYVESQFICSTDSSKLTSPPIQEGPSKGITIKELKEKKKDNIESSNDLFRQKLLKYKARVYLLLQQPKLCRMEWKLLLTLGTPVSISTIFLKAHLEYMRGNFKKSLKLLNSASDNLEYRICGESAAVLYYNNVACINYANGKPNLAAFYFQKALEENKKAVESVRVKETDPMSSQPLYTLGGDRHYELMFSLGVSLLQAEQATKAFDCFTEAAQKLHNSPSLWLKLAECCIYCHKPSNEVDFDIPKRREDMVQKVVGTGAHRKIILASALSKDTQYHVENLSYAIPQPTLEFGMLCLKNALFTLPEEEQSTRTFSIPSPPNPSVSSAVTSGLQSAIVSLASPGHILGNPPAAAPIIPVTSKVTAVESSNLKIAILGASAYVSLCLGDYIAALEHSKSLLAIEKIPGAYRMLGNLYAAECLILMDKINEAIDHLKIENFEDLNTSIPVPDALDRDKTQEKLINTKKWFPTSLVTAKAILRYNLAVAYATRGELDKSSETLKEVWVSKGPDCDIPIHVIMLALYIELQKGNVDIARSIVKLHCPQYWS